MSNYPPAANGYGQPPYGYANDFTPMYRPPQAYEPNAMVGPQRISMSGASGGSIQGMFTRNLIGNCAGSAFRLQDTKEQIGIWFVMQDLSVRTEGCFRYVHYHGLLGDPLVLAAFFSTSVFPFSAFSSGT